MKTLFNVLIGLYIVVTLTVVGLALTGHLVVVSEPGMTNVVDDNHKVLFQMANGLVFYHVEFVR